MKKKNTLIFTLLITLAMVGPVSARTQTDTSGKGHFKLYLEAGAGGGTRHGAGGGIGLECVLRKKWMAAASYQSVTANPRNLPSDFVPESGIVLFFPYEQHVTVEMNLLSLTAGRFYKAGQNSWYTLEGGLSLVQGQKAKFQKQARSASDPSYYLFGISSSSSNYKVTYEKKTSIGAMFKADWNWAFSRFAGIGLGAYLNLNPIQSPLGLELKMILGDMGRAKRNRR